jgi:hypothetical protein
MSLAASVTQNWPFCACQQKLNRPPTPAVRSAAHRAVEALGRILEEES